jgi:parallel beta-helix repeat protein
MKQFLAGIAAVLGAALSPAALAVNYFVDTATGNDAYTGTSATVQSGTPMLGPWRTLGKVNGATLQPGDNVFFRCGQSWRGTLRTASSPDPARPIRYSRFGSDCTATNKPLFTTAATITGWQPWNDNVWVAPAPFPITHAYASGQALRLAQHPNLDYAVQSWARGMYVVDQSPPPPNTTRGLLDQELAAIADRDLVGAGIRIRVQDWIINDLVITAFDPVALQLTFNQPTGWAVRRNWGYYLDNKLWMLDAPGEFFYDAADPAGPRLYVWMPDGAAPGTRLEAANDGFAIDASGATNVVIEALRAEKAGVGVALPSSSNVTVRAVDVADSQIRGMVANGATAGTIESCTIQRSVREGILLGSGSNFRVVNNRVFDSGVIGSPKQSRGAISAFGTDDIISGNHVRNSGFHGISYGKRTNVANNLVENSCLVLNDCGGIYTGNAAGDISPHNSFVIANTIVGVANDRNGRDPAPLEAITPGIYLDYRTTGVYVARNTVMAADSGAFIAAASNNTLADNVFYDYRTGAIRLKEYTFARITTPNRILRNQFFALSDMPPFFLNPVTADASLMATFDGNRFSSLYASDPARLTMAQSSRSVSGVWTTTALDLAQWRALGNDLTSTIFSDFGIEPFAFAPVTGVNLLTNGTFDADTTGWRASSAQNDATLAWSATCPAPGCASLATGVASPSGSLVSGTLPVAAGKTYVVTFNARSATPALTVNVVPRRAGPGSFDLFQSRFPVNLQDTWRPQKVLFSVPPELVFGPGDNGARVDFATGSGSTFWLDDVRVQEVTFSQNDPYDDSMLLMNTGGAPASVGCPDAVTRPDRCGEYAWFATGQPVGWPVQLPARASAIVIWTGNPFRDN